MKFEILRRPSAFIPLTLSFVALGLVIGHYLLFGIVDEADEGTPAHIFQLLIVVQVPVIVFFASKWLPQNWRQTCVILALQGGAAVAAITSVLLLT